MGEVMIKSIEGSPRTISVGDLKELIKSVPDNYILCLSKNDCDVSFIDISAIDDDKECYIDIQ